MTAPTHTAQPEIRPLGHDERSSAIPLLARAFALDPAMVALQPSARRRRRMLERWFASLAFVGRRVGRRPLLGAFDGGVLVGAALSYGAATYPPPAWMAVLHGPAVALAGPTAVVRSARWLSAREQVRPRSEHFSYLELPGTDPLRQGQGTGGALLRTLLADADACRHDVVLHANTAKNVRWYERAGFVVTHTVLLPFGVREWLLERRPAEPS